MKSNRKSLLERLQNEEENFFNILKDMPSDAIWVFFHLSKSGKLPHEATCIDCADYAFCNKNSSPLVCCQNSKMKIV